MHKYLSDYMRHMEQLLASDAPLDYSAEIQRHLNKIQFMQHERLIHFMVTMLFALVLFLCVGFFVVTESGMLLALTGLVLVLLVPYIFHYYFLENTVQKMYVVYDQLLALQAKQSVADKTAVQP